MTMQTIGPGTLIVAGKGTDTEAKFLILPTTMPNWVTALQVSGPTLQKGEQFVRSAPKASMIFGADYELITNEELRLMARDGHIRCMLIPKE